jgi:hypothetical protein
MFKPAVGMKLPAASCGVSSYLLDRHSVLHTACPVLDTGESSLVFLDTGLRRYDESAASRGEWDL